jgi:hypothetical protein
MPELPHRCYPETVSEQFRTDRAGFEGRQVAGEGRTSLLNTGQPAGVVES